MSPPLVSTPVESEEKQLADELWAQGVIQYRAAVEKQAVGGLKAFQESLIEDPEHADRQFFVSCLLVMYGRNEEAIETFEDAIAANTASDVAYLDLCLFLETLQRYDEARAVAQRAIDAGAYWANQWQRCPLFVAGLASRPFWAAEDFPWSAELEASFPDIKVELTELVLAKGARDADDMPDGWSSVGGEGRFSHDSEIVKPGGEWREFVVFSSLGEEPDVDKYVPKTKEVIEKLLPEAVTMARLGAGEIIFSAMAPGTRVATHCASSNTRLTCHLGLLAPAGAAIRVGTEWRGWEEGRCMFFDDSFEHEVVHEGESMRVVLLIRFWHPDLPEDRRMSTLQEGLSRYEEMQRRRMIPPQSPAVRELVRAKMPQKSLESLMTAAADTQAREGCAPSCRVEEKQNEVTEPCAGQDPS